ncbi:asparagine synthase (glutamine-hydrolyzing) [Bacillus sp. S/N-304-OC-R1]|uniref:asparagine synthase (glutamine-hydrolyzing) n=1 Tax=Bacillus sp. S/N-304-OC-R1 TaxID=2758034 RepID=UPI001C8E722A|nr:asparagine synthase (glutamine-hydrolyzing) [Bacillus sp. S/N-304-OC-R1]MBY0124178.1 asparagine synthase (glutamine-hydrolyzing) [Bacillus sp. S/N-304-OC-R1]
MHSFFVGYSDKQKIQDHRGSFDYADKHIELTYSRLGDANQQLIFSLTERYVIVFDGEIYYDDGLQQDLINEEIILKTNTEVLLILYSRYKEQMIEKLRGMFSFVIWDSEEKVLFGARDRFGIKPLYYYESAEENYFATEMKSIRERIKCTEINNEAVQHYLSYQFVPEQNSLTCGIKKLEPGHYFIKKMGQPMKVTRYWKAVFHPVAKQEADFTKEIRDALAETIQLHLQADLPIGSFLSGGVDSTIIASIAKEYYPGLKTFTVGFEQQGFSELDVAQETAVRLGIDNISRVITPEEFMNELPKIIYSLEDPLADPACIPLYFAAKEAKKYVKVVMSGEGADELFGGYRIYHEPHSLKLFQYFPHFLKRVLRSLVKLIPDGMKGRSFIERGVTPLEERYIGNAKIFSEEEKEFLFQYYNEGLSFTKITAPLYKECAHYDQISRMQYIDLHTWLRGDILLKADKVARAHSLIFRLPFLDRKIFEIASQIPSSLKVSNRTTKYILRKAAEGIIPDHVLHRKKLGFPVPIRLWLKNEMHDWAKKIIRESNTDHLFNKDYVYKLLDDHCSNKQDNSRKLWTVIIFMLWYSVYFERKFDSELPAALIMSN